MSDNDINSQTDAYYEPRIWKFLSMILALGIAFILIVSTKSLVVGVSPSVSVYSNIRYYLTALGLALLIAGASFSLGGLLGFLFGIPRLLNSINVPDNLKIKNQIMQNDNLVQISDWITKIIVGVGLTQFYQVPKGLMSIGEYLAPSFSNNNFDDLSAKHIAIVVVLYFLVVGFLCSYLWTRLYFSKMLAENQNEIDSIQQELDQKNLELTNKEKELKEKEEALLGKSNEVKAFKTSFSDKLLELKSKKESTLNNEDPNKNKFGGKSEVNERIIKAKVTPTSYDSELFTIILEVSSTNDKNPISNQVEFHLHPTFNNSVETVKVNEGKAKLNLIAYGSFTVGVVCDDGKTKLELDLAELPNVPKLFKER